MNGIKKRCIRCKELKPKTIGNFKRRESYLSFKPDFDRICRECKDKEENAREPTRVYKAKKRQKKVCESEECEQTFVATRSDQRYCGRDCMLAMKGKKNTEKLQQERIELARNPKKEIPQKFLVRGKIYGVDY